MDYPSTIWEELTDHDKKATWNLFHEYIYAHSQILFDKCPGDVVPAISIFQSQCANIKFSDQSIYNRMFQQVLHKGRESEINYNKSFQNAKALEISVENSSTEDQLVHTFLDHFQKSGN